MLLQHLSSRADVYLQYKTAVTVGRPFFFCVFVCYIDGPLKRKFLNIKNLKLSKNILCLSAD